MLQFELPSLSGIQAAWTLAISAFTAAGGYFTKLGLDARAAHKDRFESAVEAKAMKSLISIASGIPEDDITLEAVRRLLSSNKQALDEVVHYIQTTPEPHLVWIKKRISPLNFKMVQVNYYYAHLFLGKPAAFYTGKSDHQVFPPDMAAEFARNDEAAAISGQTQQVRETVYSAHTGERGTFVGTKWSFQVGQSSYVCGMGRFESQPMAEKLPKSEAD